jgi:acyl-CoA reductase-like NAD-dependent aldehyde dehydrogenase
MPQIQTTISPIDQQPVLTRPLLTDDQLDHVVAESVRAYKGWRKVSLDDRLAIAEKWMVGPLLPYAEQCADTLRDRPSLRK